MAFPSQQPINLSPTKMMDPFSGAKDIGIELPKLNDFLKITQLSSYAGKLKKLKCAETEDLINAAARVGFLHVEEQRVRRYLDHFYQGVLVQAEAKPQPITLDNFFKLSNLNHVLKFIRKYGVVEFDDLQWIAYSDLATLLSKKVEVQRLKRYCDRVANAPDIGVIETEVQTAAEILKTFIIDAQLKSFKGTFEKLGVVETDDLIFVDRSDLPKMKQVEYERFGRYREKFTKRTQDRRTSSTQQPNTPTNNLQQVSTDVTQDRRISSTHQPKSPTNKLQQVRTDVTHQHAPYPVKLSQPQPNLVNPGQLPHYPMPNQQPQQFIPQVLPQHPQSQPLSSPKRPPNLSPRLLSPDHQQQTYNKQNPPPVRRKTWQNLPRPSETFLSQEKGFDAGHSHHNLVHQNTYPPPQKAFNPSYG